MTGGQSEPARLPTAASVAVLYAALFGALGMVWPYFTIFFRSRGIAAHDATRVLSLFSLMSLFAPPIAGLLADLWHARGLMTRVLTIAMAVAFTGYAFDGEGAVWLTTAVFAFFRSPLTSIIDASCFEVVRRTGGSYGRIRLWGSLGFLVGALLSGQISRLWGIDRLMYASWLALVGVAVCAWRVPTQAPRPEPSAGREWLTMLACPDVWLLYGGIAIAQIASAAYDSCYSMHLRSLGHGDDFVGASWAIGVAAEVALLSSSGRVFAKIGAAWVWTMALLVAALRWWLIGHVTSPLLILALQPLHGISFGYAYAASVTLVREQAPEKAATAALGLFSAANGVGLVLGMSVSGTVFEQHGAKVLFGAAAGLSTLASLVAVSYALARRRRLA